ncbi:von Willebrand factor A domain-containing protein 7 [Hippoglossus stenolepis]|uniref:von Willebrand factor A domain-containing protein 7 n=1 Tax=Hippoglossus stenolepis TaxID=195615 RepID=UPI001FAFB1CC|nr:von Willebrand factor A domain-containing protein 7 [Hippoglossus stenolepis]XP_035034948.2 von Willebrand factor A domain-containing protein 7 [Hippoglossus stenolepis]
MSSELAVLCLLLLHTGAHGFAILPGKSQSHLEITEGAILKVVVQVCRDLAQAEGTDFTFPSQPYTTEAVAVACNAKKSSRSFLLAVTSVILRNVRVDLRHALNGSFHFDDEMFVQGRRIIAEGVQAVKASNKQENFEAAMEKLGEILHPLQDFYSHSNWVELGKKFPNSNLIRPDTSIGNLADISRATCRNCDGDDCTNNILEDVIAQGILTSGYFGIVPRVSTKPDGKCSHGGGVDQTSTIEPKGGINKDTFDSNHGHLHTAAANMAVAATGQLLDDVRAAAGDRAFLQMLGISKGSSKALCFVIDTTKSMSDDIEAVKKVTSSIINSEVGTENEPSTYILVPFSDPEFGPLTKTTDPQVFKNAINSLSVTGGGDDAEMSLSGLKLALTAAPLNSEIFLFTDAPAKDKHLKSAVIALIERTQTVVNFMITDSTVTNRRILRDKTRRRRAIASSDAQVYKDLAQASGGLAIEVTKTELPVATSIITESTSSSLVTLLQAARNPGKTDNFFFRVDGSVTNPRVYITGRSVTFTLISPEGKSQQSSDPTVSLITSSQSVGNFRTLRIKTEVGKWEIRMVSTNPYTLKVIGQSSVDFLFDFVEASQGPFTGYDTLDTRPRAGVNGTLLVTLTGTDSVKLTEVALVESSGSKEVKGVVESQGSDNFLVRVDQMPSEEFVVRVRGQDGSSSSGIFQRQTPTNFRASNVTITADSNPILVPGTLFSVPFSVTSGGTGGNFTIRATNNQQRFNSVSPTSLILVSGNSTDSTVNITAPLNTPSGTDFTMTIEAEAPGGADTNYVMLRFSVLNTVTDFTKPVCQLLSLQSRCVGACNSSTWDLSVQVTDGDDGVGVERVTLKQGNGSMNASLAAGNANTMLVSYRASCCSPDMELLAVDRVGNVGLCFYSLTGNSPVALSSSTKVTQSVFLFLSMVVLGLHVTTVGGNSLIPGNL